MKKTTLILATLFSGIIHAETDFKRMYDREHGKKNTETPEQIIKSHAEGSKLVAREQDELSADVQELIQGETNAKVIDFLAEAEELMAQATDRLEELDTSGATIAIETEIIEKIGAAAKQKQQSGEGEGKSGALMEMMQQMMGQGSEGKKPGDKPGKGPGGKTGGEGQEADSGTGNETSREKSDGKTESRRLPKKSGSAGTELPREFNKALDAFNKGLNTSK
ncbi:hypothetical protein [Rubritalea profundi]|uniref:Uncharacterized protein n=1 Tax=Rubritalea profundi TaxID=1658618 RepID=A0A2S7U0C1_9BACT|nr:hypothetical protein [Rubritalea profundi]PQJ27844.1 hypothetical protein BSZ32_04580 [Rubritalea profundi]